MIRWGRIANSFISAALGALFVVALFYVRPIVPPGPGPGPEPIPQGKGDHVVVVVDNTSPSIPQALILDNGLSRAMKKAGKLAICDLREEWTKAKRYDTLVAKAGGAPAVIILDKSGDDVYSGRLPTDAKAFTALMQKSVLDLPPPLATAPRPRVVDLGRGMPSGADNGIPWIQVNGDKRMLNARMDPVKMQALQKYGDHNPTFPQSEWFELNRQNVYGSPEWILDQNGVGQCVACGWVGALRRGRATIGASDVPLSSGFLYSLINGGQDQGAVISDGIDALKNVGTCTFATVGIKPFYTRQMPPGAREEAKRFRLADAYRCDTWEELVSALLTGRFYPVYGVMVGNNFSRFDSNGVAGHDRGPGNHCMMADGLRKLPDGRWVLDNVNSWSPTWGPFKNGRCYLDKNHLFSGGVQPNICVLRLPSRDPQDTFDPPAWKGN
jgi:hypothetical protein